MEKTWMPEKIETGLLSGRAGMTEYALHYPKTGSNAQFDRWWLHEVEQLRRKCIQMAGAQSAFYAAEWQETLQSPKALSGFLDISCKRGYANWQMWRVSATFLAEMTRPAPLGALFFPGRQRQLAPMLEAAVEQLAKQTETPFFRGAAQKALLLLSSGGYYLTGEGLALWFPQETLAPRNAGLPTVLLPYEMLKGMLRFSF